MNTEKNLSRKILKRFVVFEGIDGTGTTTQMNILSRRLSDLDVPYFCTAEPTDSPVGAMIRRALSGDYPVRPETLAYLYATDRNEHLYGENGIQNQLLSGKLVISDRYFFSSLAYQGFSCGSELPERLNSGFPLPSLLVYFELSPETAFNRISNRGVPDIFERREILSEVAAAYERILKRFSSEGLEILRIDGSLPITAVSDLIWSAIFARFLRSDSK